MQMVWISAEFCLIATYSTISQKQKYLGGLGFIPGRATQLKLVLTMSFCYTLNGISLLKLNNSNTHTHTHIGDNHRRLVPAEGLYAFHVSLLPVCIRFEQL